MIYRKLSNFRLSIQLYYESRMSHGMQEVVRTREVHTAGQGGHTIRLYTVIRRADYWRRAIEVTTRKLATLDA